VVALLNLLKVPSLAVLVEFNTLGVRLVNIPAGLTFGGKTYTAAVLKCDGFGENLLWEAPSATLEIASLDGTQQARFLNDSFRGDTVTLTVLYASGGSWLSTGWSSTYTADAETCSANSVVIRLASMDAVQGTEVPRRTTQEHGCQHDFMRGGCHFRWYTGLSIALKECDKGYDTPNGCKAHFPDLGLATGRPWEPTSAGARIAQPKPYGGFLGAVDHRLVLGGR